MASRPPVAGPAGPASDADTGLRIWSCVVCRRRKIRCDRHDPCANCVRANAECHFPVTGRDPDPRRSPAQRQAELLGRLRRLETVVTELAAQVEDGDGPAQQVVGAQAPPAAASQGPGSEFDEDFGRLVIDKDGGLHVGNRFWCIFCSEVDSILQAVHDVAEADQAGGAGAPAAAAVAGAIAAGSSPGLIFGGAGRAATLDGLSPLPSQVPFLWQTYLERVDPFIKVLHAPTMDRVVRGVRDKFSTLGRDVEPLLFAVSMAAVLSMDKEEVAVNFDAPKAQLLARYWQGTEQALSRARFLTSQALPVAQALVIYMSLLVLMGPEKVAWPMAGLLLRIAKQMGLHSEELIARRGALAAELCRRLWRHICFVDAATRKAAMPDVSIAPSSLDTRRPSDCDDAGLPAPPADAPSLAVTDMTLCLMRCENWYLVSAIRSDPGAATTQSRLDLVGAARTRIENRYARFLRADEPFESLVKTVMALSLAPTELAICTPRSLPADDSDQPAARLRLHLALSLIDRMHTLRTEPAWAPWRWQLGGHIPWHATGIFLHHVLHAAWDPRLERAWQQTAELMALAPPGLRVTSMRASLCRMVERVRSHRDGAAARAPEGHGGLAGPSRMGGSQGRSARGSPLSSGSAVSRPDAAGERPPGHLLPGHLLHGAAGTLADAVAALDLAGSAEGDGGAEAPLSSDGPELAGAMDRQVWAQVDGMDELWDLVQM